MGFNLFVLLFVVTPCLLVARFRHAWSKSQLKKIIQKRAPFFIAELTIILMLHCLCGHLRDVSLEDNFEFGGSAAGTDFVSSFRLELMYIPSS